MNKKRILCIIPARGGSKSIPYKNIALLNKKPLIMYSIDISRQMFSDSDICVSTDNKKIIDVVESCGLSVSFIRPDNLATDTATTQEVLKHALLFYENKNIFYDIIILLQPTSPFRLKRHLEEALKLYTDDCDMVVSVKKASANPYYDLFEENESGYLHISKGDNKYTRRQDVPTVWEYNGSIFIINCKSLKENNISDFSKIRKYCMEDIYSIDIDTPMDLLIAEELIKNKIVVL